jgi:hypothetical protein
MMWCPSVWAVSCRTESLTVQGHFLVYPARHAKRPEAKIFVQRLYEQTG